MTNSTPSWLAKFIDGEPRVCRRAAAVRRQTLTAAGSSTPARSASFGFLDKFSLSAWVNPADAAGGTIVSRMKDASQASGYYVVIAEGKVQVNLVMRWLDDALRVETERSLPPGEWHHVLVTYDGSRVASGIKIYIDGQPER